MTVKAKEGGRDPEEQGKLERASEEREHDPVNKMDPAKLSPSPKSPTPAMKGGSEVQQEEVDTSALRPGAGNGDVEMEKNRDPDPGTDGQIPHALMHLNHKGAIDKHRFNTVGHQKRRRQKLVYFTTERKGHGKPRTVLKQVFFYPGVSDKSPATEGQNLVDFLSETLESYRVPDLRDWKSPEGCGVPGLPLEDSWTDIVHSHLTMEKTERHQQEALWELIHTELAYIYKLTIVTDLVMGALKHLHRHGFLLEVTPEHLFSNMASVLSAHRLFWSEVMLPMLEEVRKTGSPFDPVRLEKGCMQFQERFSTYFQYCWEEERIVEFARRLMDVNPQFRTYITWVENHPSCGRMRLGDMQAKPHQRITKYPLLLAAVLKYTQDHKSQYAVRKMLSNVSSFLDSINAYMKFKDQELALSLIAQRVEGYEVMEAINEEVEKHVRDFCRFDLTSPIPGGGPRDIRKLLLEETLRIRERRESKVEVVVLLFSDVLLLTKAQRKSEKLKVVRPPLALDRLTCAALKDDCSFVLVEVGGLGCAVNVYVVVAPSSESRAQWIDSIQVTQASLKAMREREQVQRLGGFLQSHMQMETQAIPPSEEILNILGTNTEEPSDPSESAQVPSSDVQEGTGSTQSDNEKLASREMEGTNLYQGKQEKWDLQYMDKSFLFSQPAHEDFKSTRKLLKKLHGFNYLEMSELEAAEDSESSQQEKREIVFNHINERKVTWNNSRSTYPDLSKLLTPKTDSTKSHSSSNTSLMFDMESDLESSCSQSEYRDLLYDRNQGSESESFTRESKRDSGISQSEDDALREMWRFTRKLKSPRLRRRRLLAQHGLLPQAHNKSSLDAAISAPSSSSGFSSEDKQMPGWNLFSSDQRGDAWAVDDLGSVKQSQGIARCSSAQGDSPATQTFPPAELLIRENGQSSQKMPRLKSQRSLSVPDIERQEAQGVSMSPTWSDSNISFYSQTKMVPKLQNSALEEILKRATAREQDKQKRVGKLECKKWTVLDPVSSPSLTASLPLYPSDAGQERPRKVPDRRQERQGDANRGLKYSLFLGDGTSVDWEGWCFDDNEVMFFLDPDGGRGSADTNGTLTSVTLSDFHEDQRSSEV